MPAPTEKARAEARAFVLLPGLSSTEELHRWRGGRRRGVRDRLRRRRLLGGGQSRDYRRLADGSGGGTLDADAVTVKRIRQQLQQRRAVPRIGCRVRDQRVLGDRQQPLLLQHIGGRRGAQLVLLLLGV